MSSTDADEVNPYELLGVTLESTEAEIRTAYRQRSLKVHPDRNPGNPDAARKFHELNQAYELLLDPLRRMALDAKLRVKEARKARFATYDAKRKGLVEELEARERAFKKARVEKEEEERVRWHESERIMEEGRRLREEREKGLRKRAQERDAAERVAVSENEPPTLGALDTTIRLRYQLHMHPTLTTASSIHAILAPFGSIDKDSIVISLKPTPPRRPKRGTALVPFRQISGAFAAVCASGRAESGLRDVEVDWAGGSEPELIGWLRKMGKLGNESNPSKELKPEMLFNASRPELNSSNVNATPVQKPSMAFASFPSSFPDLDSVPLSPRSSTGGAAGLDYESLTLMRLRQAERARLEREIREQEAAEGD